MTTTKTGTDETSQPGQECCMCGDYGLSYELFSCKVCKFRSQHRYCSNLYPKAEAYDVCNWCLSQNDKTAEKTQSSLNSSSSNKNTSEDATEKTKKKEKEKKKKENVGINGNRGSLKNAKGSRESDNWKLQSPKGDSNLIKKQSPPERSSARTLLAARKRITTIGAMQEKLRRTRSEEISNRGMIRKEIFRNKVRKYKLLNEVTSQ